MSTQRLIRRCTELSIDTTTDITAAAAYALRLLAHRIHHLNIEIHDLTTRITDTITAHNPEWGVLALIDKRYVGA